MTREEAIEMLDDIIGVVEDNQGRDYDGAFRMAIEALQFVKHFDLLKEYQSLQEVVRCKDCRWYENACTFFAADPFEQAPMEKNDFCSYGERREE